VGLGSETAIDENHVFGLWGHNTALECALKVLLTLFLSRTRVPRPANRLREYSDQVHGLNKRMALGLENT
jgi:hypothetical protein